MRRRKLPLGKPVKITWLDSMSFGGWQYNTTTVGDVARITTLGYVVNCHPDCITVSTSIGARGGVLDPVSIPWGAIETIDFPEGAEI